ncbi:hypothetical protein BpHYR1_019052 [Brachionus plicatilis]|uniref:Uncharacterized protein n=1 Tax=Brachionus plicatilis TaxID=10195 RepID=A0A3M7P4D2_BRAPC|nr:hypothetical protein BpHYR1_019052 [Brachionus plicatilis]
MKLSWKQAEIVTRMKVMLRVDSKVKKIEFLINKQNMERTVSQIRWKKLHEIGHAVLQSLQGTQSCASSEQINKFDELRGRENPQQLLFFQLTKTVLVRALKRTVT